MSSIIEHMKEVMMRHDEEYINAEMKKQEQNNKKAHLKVWLDTDKGNQGDVL